MQPLTVWFYKREGFPAPLQREREAKIKQLSWKSNSRKSRFGALAQPWGKQHRNSSQHSPAGQCCRQAESARLVSTAFVIITFNNRWILQFKRLRRLVPPAHSSAVQNVNKQKSSSLPAGSRKAQHPSASTGCSMPPLHGAQERTELCALALEDLQANSWIRACSKGRKVCSRLQEGGILENTKSTENYSTSLPTSSCTAKSALCQEPAQGSFPQPSGDNPLWAAAFHAEKCVEKEAVSMTGTGLAAQAFSLWKAENPATKK